MCSTLPGKNAQPALGQRLCVQQGLDLSGQSLQIGGVLRLVEAADQAGQGVHYLGKSGSFPGFLPGGLVAHQVGGPLEQQGKQVIVALLFVRQMKQVPPVIAQPVELLGGVIQLLADGGVAAVPGQQLQQLRQADQGRVDLAGGVGRPVEQAGIQFQRRNEQGKTEDRR